MVVASPLECVVCALHASFHYTIKDYLYLSIKICSIHYSPFGIHSTLLGRNR